MERILNDSVNTTSNTTTPVHTNTTANETVLVTTTTGVNENN